MRKILIILLILTIITTYAYTVNFTDTYIFGTSFNYQANQNLWEGALDIMQRTEDYSKLYKQDILYFNYDNYATIGINKNLFLGPVVLLFQYNDNSVTQDSDEDVSIINDSTTVSETKTDIDATVDRTINIGIGMGLFKKIGVSYALNWWQTNTETEYTTVTSERSNAKSWEIQKDEYKILSNAGIFRNVLEGAVDLGNLKAILQLQLAFENGDDEDNMSETKTTQKTKSNKKIADSSTVITGRDAGNNTSNFDPDELSSTVWQIDAEAKYRFEPLDTIFEINFGYATRSVSDDVANTSVEETHSYDTNSNIEIAYTNNTTTIKYTKNNDYAMKIALKVKKKISPVNRVRLGFYPKYQIEIKKCDYDITTTREIIIKQDNNTNGSYTDVGTDVNTVTTFSGDIDNYSKKEVNHIISLPIGMEIFPVKPLAFRFGLNLTYSILSTAIQKSETQNYNKSEYVDNNDSSNNVTTSYKNRVDVDVTNTVDYVFSTTLSYGIGFKISENFVIDLLGEATGPYFSIGSYKLSATYYF